MTNEEAIKCLKDMIAIPVWDIKNADAVELAIKALGQEPCEDCISRQAVLDKLNRLIEVERLQGTDEMGYGRERVSAYETMIFEIESEYLYPSVTPQPKTGHWEYVQYDYNPKLGNWHCSECRNIVMECVNKNDKGGIPIYKYCPNCGAKMAESEDEE